MNKDDTTRKRVTKTRKTRAKKDASESKISAAQKARDDKQINDLSNAVSSFEIRSILNSDKLRNTPVERACERLSMRSSQLAGSSWGFGVALLIVLVWAASGPFLQFSELWQLTINTGTTIITFLMVFLIQRAQNKDVEAINVKLNELIKAIREADNELLDAEQLTEDELNRIKDLQENVVHDHHRKKAKSA